MVGQQTGTDQGRPAVIQGGELAVGAEAPDFTSSTQHGTEVSLSDLLAESAVLVVFYPFAFTGTCTGELRRLEELSADFLAAGVRPVSISCDAMFSQRVFAEQEGYSFWMLNDFWPHGAIARSYGVFHEDRGCAVRGSFLIGRDGRIVWSVVNPIGTARDLDDHLQQARTLLR